MGQVEQLGWLVHASVLLRLKQVDSENNNRYLYNNQLAKRVRMFLPGNAASDVMPLVSCLSATVAETRDGHQL